MSVTQQEIRRIFSRWEASQSIELRGRMACETRDMCLAAITLKVALADAIKQREAESIYASLLFDETNDVKAKLADARAELERERAAHEQSEHSLIMQREAVKAELAVRTDNYKYQRSRADMLQVELERVRDLLYRVVLASGSTWSSDLAREINAALKKDAR